ncbi:hypothetical protein ACCO45_009363 [Purpureocillium lilacinum]|uniref:Uncharacterized protein n=1 Tax=Purpureocillium lilacinum TaxID=33203 RepID=A0ACC4DK83_PURLI
MSFEKNHCTAQGRASRYSSLISRKLHSDGPCAVSADAAVAVAASVAAAAAAAAAADATADVAADAGRRRRRHRECGAT